MLFLEYDIIEFWVWFLNVQKVTHCCIFFNIQKCPIYPHIIEYHTAQFQPQQLFLSYIFLYFCPRCEQRAFTFNREPKKKNITSSEFVIFQKTIIPCANVTSGLTCAGSGGRIGQTWQKYATIQTYSSAWRKSLSKRGDQASPAQLGITARLKGSL